MVYFVVFFITFSSPESGFSFLRETFCSKLKETAQNQQNKSINSHCILGKMIFSHPRICKGRTDNQNNKAKFAQTIFPFTFSMTWNKPRGLIFSSNDNFEKVLM